MGNQRTASSIIIPCFNQLSHTRECLRAIARHTDVPFELIVIDNGSTDGTGDFLRGVAAAAVYPVTIVSNPRNLGYPAACNQGLALARGEYLVLLNNDAVPTDCWLDQLIGLVESDPEMGIVGPMSNYATPPQLIQEVPYCDLSEMQTFATRWREEHRGLHLEVPKLSGFCLLIKRAVYTQLGGLDERFGLGLFDDDDYCLRATRAGWRLAVALDLFVHHTGSRTMSAIGVDRQALMSQNRERFDRKWGDLAPKGREVGIVPWMEGNAEQTPFFVQMNTNESHGHANGHATHSVSQEPSVEARAQGRRLSTSLTMIVRDEQDNLPDCLGSVEGLFDEIVIVDTGSTDNTKDIARSFGARVFDFPWVDDFAAARNAALARATGDYVFWLDADDRVDPAEKAKLMALLQGLSDTNKAFVLQCSCDPEPGASSPTVVDHVRLFPRRPEVTWTYRVHEQILPSLRRAGVDVVWEGVTIRHVGYVDAVTRDRKLERDERILLAELEERPDDPFVCFNLGNIALERGEVVEALEYYQRSRAGSAPTDSIVLKLQTLMARCYQQLGDMRSALEACHAGLGLQPKDAELWFRRAMVLLSAGRPEEAESSFRHVLRLKRPEGFASQDTGIYGHLTYRNLARLAEGREAPREAMVFWEGVLRCCPGDGEAMGELARVRGGLG